MSEKPELSSADAAPADHEEAFLEAIRKGRVDEVRQLLSQGMDPNQGNSYSETTLHYAVPFGQRAVAEILLEAGAAMEGRDRHGFTPLIAAAGCGQIEMVRLLLDHGADINALQGSNGDSALMWAAREGHDEVITLLLARGANARIRDRYGRNAADIAASTGRSRLIDALRGAAAI